MSASSTVPASAARADSDATTARDLSLFDVQLARAKEELASEEARLQRLRAASAEAQRAIASCDVAALRSRVKEAQSKLAKKRAAAASIQADAEARDSAVRRLQGPRKEDETAAAARKDAAIAAGDAIVDAAVAALIPHLLAAAERDTIAMAATRRELQAVRDAATRRCDALRVKAAALRASTETDRVAGSK
eukprot:CAMPEP_0174842274 /NCGR_PEP_ID=MMETSP1114-20130205/9809_1 /TAXON_ID=312471 /ORGANISM="Neobodo designis, Strain CCAP 1951/1" /LENGTH=191 /DNA_ID=CAMNT_0016076473 /DNA_START=106 /DNA_END=678 /DNA_ORIENTATION=+